MSNGTKLAIEVCKPIPLSDPAKELLKEDLQPRPFLDLLLEKELHSDAALFMAHAIPKREAVWWGCQCARQGYGTPPGPIREILESAEAWAANPTDEQRRTTFRLAETAGFDSPAGLLGMAVFFSSGSLAPLNLPAVPPSEHLTANAVGNAVNVSAMLQGAEKAPALYPGFFALGFDVATGKNRWKEPPV